MALRIGVDSGGTFTDICLFEESTGQIAVWKVSSTPADPSRAVVSGVAEALAQIGAQARDVSYFGHGTTVATNALIQHRGALTGLITSDGFRDLLEIGRQKRPDLYDLQADKPQALIERRLRREVPERLLHDGHVETALDEAAVRDVVRVLRNAHVEAVGYGPPRSPIPQRANSTPPMGASMGHHAGEAHPVPGQFGGVGTC
jgi:N-methylhydantoinase A